MLFGDDQEVSLSTVVLLIGHLADRNSSSRKSYCYSSWSSFCRVLNYNLMVVYRFKVLFI